MGLTLEICALPFPEARARLLHPRSQANLDVLGHDLFRLGHVALAHHLLDALYAAVAVVEAFGDVLRQLLDLVLLGLLGVLVIEAGQDVLLVEALEGLRLARDVRQQVRHLVRYVGPARGQQVHLDDGVAIVVVGAGQQALLVLRGRRRGIGAAEVGKTGTAGAGVTGLLRRVVRIGLAIGDVTVVEGSVSKVFRKAIGKAFFFLLKAKARQGSRGERAQLVLQIGAVSPHGGRLMGEMPPSVCCGYEALEVQIDSRSGLDWLGYVKKGTDEVEAAGVVVWELMIIYKQESDCGSVQLSAF